MRTRTPGHGIRRAILAAAALLPVLQSAVGVAGAVSDFTVRVDGKILRKASGRLVLSLSAFELSGQAAVRLENRSTGESRTVGISSAYADLSYSDPLPPDQFDRFREDEWIPSVEWRIPDTREALNRRLTGIHEEQNRLRRELGSALLEGGDPAVKVSSRVTLNKIEKYHRIGATIAREIFRLGSGDPDENPFTIPVLVEVGFNPFGAPSPSSRTSPLEQAREVLYWEVHRILTQQFGVRETVVDFIYEGPATIRRFAPPPGTPADGFIPSVLLSPLALDTAVYLSRQGIEQEVAKLVRLKMYKDRFITDRDLLNAFVNEGRVVSVNEGRVAVSFIPPFLKTGETLFVDPGDAGGKEIPVVPATVRESEGYSVVPALSEEVVSRIRPGMAVRRK
ncbi:MAG TPA: hypothetical protein VF853_07745 [Candidatus Deferrimicrobiaceae bacterium]